MTRQTVKRIVILLLFLLLMGLGLCGTSLGLAFILARYSLNPDSFDPNTQVRHNLGLFLSGLGILFLYLALYVAWIRPRRIPSDPEQGSSAPNP